MRTAYSLSLLTLTLGAGLATATDQGLLQLAMPTAKVASGIQIQNSKASPLGQFLLSQMVEDSNFRQFVETTGFDPRRDLQEILSVSDGVAASKNHLVLVRGTFDVPRLLANAKTVNATAAKYLGVDVLQPQQGTTWLAFPDRTLAVIGDQTAVKAALDRRATASSLDPQLLAKVTDLSARNDAWFVSLLPLSALQGQRNAVVGNGQQALPVQSLQAVQQATFGMKFGAVVAVSADALTRSDRDAQALADVVRLIVSFASGHQTKSGQPVGALLDSLQLKTSGAAMQMSLMIPEAQLESFYKTNHK